MKAQPYLWRKLSPKEQAELLAWRQSIHRPLHSPPHRPNHGHHRFHITAACYEHLAHIGKRVLRMNEFADSFLDLLSQNACIPHAWCVLPNHYHALVETNDILKLLYQIGRFHGRTAHAWNGEEKSRGRNVFYRATERAITSERHFYATLNYIHHNPVHHGYVTRWTEWPWSSAKDYLEASGMEEAERIWREYPLKNYGQGWDNPEL